MTASVRRAGLAALAFAFWAIHCAEHIARGEFYDLLWLSNVATLLLGVGCALWSAPLVALSLAWLAVSSLLWAIDVGAGAPIDSAVLTHLGGLALAAFAVRSLGMPRGTWHRASLGLAGLLGLSRLTPPAHNVNLAFSVAPGWEAHFPMHSVYLGLLLACSTLVFLLVERMAR